MMESAKVTPESAAAVKTIFQETATLAPTAASASWQEVDFEPSLSSSIATTASDQIIKLTIARSNFTRPDVEGARAFVVSGSDISAHYPAYTTSDATNFYFYVKSTNYNLIFENFKRKVFLDIGYGKSSITVFEDKRILYFNILP